MVARIDRNDRTDHNRPTAYAVRPATALAGIRPWPEFGVCFVFCVLRGGTVVACFHYIVGMSGVGLDDGGFVPGAGVCANGGGGSGL